MGSEIEPHRIVEMSGLYKNILLLVLLTAILCGCVEGNTLQTLPQADSARLYLKVSACDGAPYLGLKTRAATYSQAVKPGEMMQTLRIVIVRPDGIVEHNRYFDFHQTPTIEFGAAEFEVSPDTEKTVYLFANENALKTNGSKIINFDFDQITVGSQFPADDVANLQISLTENTERLSGELLPMCEKHQLTDIVYTQNNLELEYTADLFVVRAATKFTFNLRNETSKEVTISNLNIDKLARIEYYMPNGTTYSAPDPDTGGREITGYNVPTVANNDYYTFLSNLANDANGNGKVIDAGDESDDFKPLGEDIYLLEGKYTDAASNGKNYKLSLTVNGNTYSEYFPELEQLPRNTHVVVNISIKGKDAEVSCTVQVMPYGAYELEPEFGI